MRERLALGAHIDEIPCVRWESVFRTPSAWQILALYPNTLASLHPADTDPLCDMAALGIRTARPSEVTAAADAVAHRRMMACRN